MLKNSFVNALNMQKDTINNNSIHGILKNIRTSDLDTLS